MNYSFLLEQHWDYVHKFFDFQYLDSQTQEKFKPYFIEVLTELQQGNSCLKKKISLQEITFFQSLTPSVCELYSEEEPHQWNSSEKLCIVVLAKDRKWVYVYLQKQWNIFFSLYRWFFLWNQYWKTNTLAPVSEEQVAGWSKGLGFQLKGKQKLAISKALNSPLTLIQGGPGTGKTTIITNILFSIFSMNPYAKIRLLTPTGKSSARLMESLEKMIQGCNPSHPLSEQLKQKKLYAQTVHKLLHDLETRWKKEVSEYFSLVQDVDFIIIDEISMISPFLFQKLLDWVHPKTRMILLGDPHQLPSIDEGFLMGYFLDPLSPLSSCVCQLDEIVRTESQDITTLIQDIQRGSVHSLGSMGYLQKISYQEFSVIHHSEHQGVYFLELMSEQESDLLPIWEIYWQSYQDIQKNFNQQDIKQILECITRSQILTPTHRGVMGTEILNARSLQFLKKHHQYVYPVMMSRNNYAIGLFNGDVGLFYQHVEGESRIAFKKYGEILDYPSDTWLKIQNQLEPSFAMTIHKAQGSEFDEVLIFLPSYILDPRFFSQELFYTAISRAKKRVILVGLENSFNQCLEYKISRQNGLSIW